MREEQFHSFLVQDEQITSKKKAVSTRISKAKSVEDEFHVNLDEIVKDDRKTYEILKRIKNDLNDYNGSYQNAVRKYYFFINNKEFPTLLRYERRNNL